MKHFLSGLAKWGTRALVLAVFAAMAVGAAVTFASTNRTEYDKKLAESKAELQTQLDASQTQLEASQTYAQELEAEVASLEEEVKKDEVTDGMVAEKIGQLGELAACCWRYSGEYTEQTEQTGAGVFGFSFNLPGTEHSVDITYSGVIRVGYQVKDIVCTLNREDKTITVTLPQAQVLENCVFLDDLQFTENSGVFSGQSSTASDYLPQIKQQELKKAESEGLYDTAEQYARSLITNFLAAFPDYTVVFT